MPETEYYNAAGVLVTGSRFVVGSQTYPVAQITSVDLLEIPPKRGCAVWLVIAGIIAAIPAAGSIGGGDAGVTAMLVVLSLMLIVAGIVLIRSTGTRYAVQIVTAAGQQRLLSSADRETPTAVVAALNEAIAARG